MSWCKRRARRLIGRAGDSGTAIAPEIAEIGRIANDSYRIAARARFLQQLEGAAGLAEVVEGDCGFELHKGILWRRLQGAFDHLERLGAFTQNSGVVGEVDEQRRIAGIHLQLRTAQRNRTPVSVGGARSLSGRPVISIGQISPQFVIVINELDCLLECAC